MNTTADFFINIQAAKIKPFSDPSKIINLIQDFSKELPIFQVIDGKSIVGKDQIISACWHAYNHFKNKMNISSQLSIEILLYIAGVRQINKALATLGVTNKTDNLIVIAGSSDNKKIKKTIDRFLKIINADPINFETKNQSELNSVLEKTAETTLIIS